VRNLEADGAAECSHVGNHWLRSAFNQHRYLAWRSKKYNFVSRDKCTTQILFILKPACIAYPAAAPKSFSLSTQSRPQLSCSLFQSQFPTAQSTFSFPSFGSEAVPPLSSTRTCSPPSARSAPARNATPEKNGVYDIIVSHCCSA
jgi:hypothetical protein